MHLRNGKTNDCNLARTRSVPALTNPSKALDEYNAYLENSGCLDGKPTEKYWGTDSQKFLVTVGQSVSVGTQLAWAGNTGPGGKRGASLGENTHLHIFFTKQDPSNNEHYFYDPYGVFAYTACYPSEVLGPLTSCSRYPVAWELTSGGKLRYSA